MFDKGFFRFTLGLSAIILLSLGLIYGLGYFKAAEGAPETATIK
ncbi:MAG TPA: hypothetical protein VHD69_02620 [Candidatus Paceibacterota bacterium]|nr:hypothetical protein [Candidatus Paceibacterota bacterium]